MSIKLLENETIQKIAAGEVVENPYSVIKELVENSIDSGATIIKVEIKSAGKKEIMVSDNGSGIDESEIELAFTKHATSKLFNFDDIYRILTFGFRGEALSSISSVSKIDINTRTSKNDFGIHCYIENSKILKSNKIGMNLGTTIYVRDLFYNVPIRRKFLKSDIYESTSITILMQSFAVANPNISFKYIKDNRCVFETNRNNSSLDNINLLFGNDFQSNLIPVKINDIDYKINGYITNNNFYKSNRNYQFIFVNGRYIKNDKIRNIIEKSISGIIPKGKFPGYIICIEVDPNLIDINIHPNKKKVKFIFEEKLYNLLNSNILDIVLNNTKSNYIEIKEKEEEKLFIEEPKKSNIECSSENIINIENDHINKDFSYNDLFKITENDIKDKNLANEEALDTKYILDTEIENTLINDNQISINCTVKNEEKNLLDYEYLGFLFNKYILLKDSMEILIIDYVNAKKRIIYENFIKNKSKDINRQVLLYPIILELNELEMNNYIKMKDELYIIGIETDLFDDNSIAIRTIPTNINSDIDAEDIRRFIIDKNVNKSGKFEDKIFCIVNNINILRNSISDYEIKETLKNLSNIDIYYNFHDKKIIRKINFENFEKLFIKE